MLAMEPAVQVSVYEEASARRIAGNFIPLLKVSPFMRHSVKIAFNKIVSMILVYFKTWQPTDVVSSSDMFLIGRTSAFDGLPLSELPVEAHSLTPPSSSLAIDSIITNSLGIGNTRQSSGISSLDKSSTLLGVDISTATLLAHLSPSKYMLSLLLF